MRDDDLGLELMRLYRELRGAKDPRHRAALRQAIDAMLDRAHDVFPASYARLDRDQHF